MSRLASRGFTRRGAMQLCGAGEEHEEAGSDQLPQHPISHSGQPGRQALDVVVPCGPIG